MRWRRYTPMLRFFVPIAILGGVTSLVACSGRDPVADNAVNGAAAPAEVDVLPPDESVATPTTDLENGDDEDVNVSDSGEGGAIPASFHGRWGTDPGRLHAQSERQQRPARRLSGWNEILRSAGETGG